MADKLKRETYTVEDVTAAFLAGTTYGGEMVREAIRRAHTGEKEMSSVDLMNATNKQLQALLVSLDEKGLAK